MLCTALTKSVLIINIFFNVVVFKKAHFCQEKKKVMHDLKKIKKNKERT